MRYEWVENKSYIVHLAVKLTLQSTVIIVLNFVRRLFLLFLINILFHLYFFTGDLYYFVILKIILGVLFIVDRPTTDISHWSIQYDSLKGGVIIRVSKQLRKLMEKLVKCIIYSIYLCIYVYMKYVSFLINYN